MTIAARNSFPSNWASVENAILWILLVVNFFKNILKEYLVSHLIAIFRGNRCSQRYNNHDVYFFSWYVSRWETASWTQKHTKHKHPVYVLCANLLCVGNGDRTNDRQRVSCCDFCASASSFRKYLLHCESNMTWVNRFNIQTMAQENESECYM